MQGIKNREGIERRSRYEERRGSSTGVLAPREEGGNWGGILSTYVSARSFLGGAADEKSNGESETFDAEGSKQSQGG